MLRTPAPLNGALERKEKDRLMEEHSTEFLDSLNKDLALAIGNAVWAFARIEWAVTTALGRGGYDLDQILAEFPFRQRTTVLKKLIPNMGLTKDVHDNVLSKIIWIEKLSERRNLIAHNPWMIWLDSDAKAIMTEIQHYTQPKRKLDMTQLIEFTEECNRALEEFEAAAFAL